MTVVVTNLAPMSEGDAQFFLALLAEFERHGHRAVLWSCTTHPLVERYRHPMSWKIRDWPQSFGRPDPARALALIDTAKWQPRIDALVKQDWDGGDRRPLLEIAAACNLAMIEETGADLFLSWNTLCPHTGIGHDLCQALGVPSLMIERAFLPNTWYLEDGGLLGHSDIAGMALDRLIAPERRADYARAGTLCLRQAGLAGFSRYAQPRDPAGLERVRRMMAARPGPKVVFFPPDDGSLGFVPRDHQDRRRTLPHYAHSFDAARKLAAANPDGVTLFKPHPSFIGHRFDTGGIPGMMVVDHDFRDLIGLCDVVATSGSGLIVNACVADKPVVLVANDIWAGKGVAYEAQDPAHLADALRRAMSREDRDHRRENFLAFLGYLYRDHLVSHPSTPHPARVPAQAVARLCARFPAVPPGGSRLETSGSRLETSGSRLETSGSRPVDHRFAHGGDTVLAPHVSTDPADLVAALAANPRADLVVDVDHTLFLTNSTEQFLAFCRPGWLVAPLLAMLDHLAPWARRGGAHGSFLWRDFVRVGAVSVLTPWNVLRWRRRAAALMRPFVNPDLARLLARPRGGRLFLLSYGFHHVLAPQMRALDFRHDALVCTRHFPWPCNIRRMGKERALALFGPPGGPPEPKTAIVVTDSLEDAPLLAGYRHAFHLRWREVKVRPHENAYYPFRYTSQGKYPGKNILANQHFGEDLAVAMIAYGLSAPGLGTFAGLAALFVSFFAVYEIGYHENDFVAAPAEAAPQVAPAARAFADFPIAAHAWPFALVSGAVGCLLAVPPAGLALALPAWAGVLGLTRACFYLHNRLTPRWRLFSFTALQGCKTLGYAAVLPLSPAGAILLGAQVARQSVNYAVYRWRGDARAVKRQTVRAVAFVVLSAIAAVVMGPAVLTGGQFAVAAAWCAYRVVRERGGVRRLWRRLKGRRLKGRRLRERT